MQNAAPHPSPLPTGERVGVRGIRNPNSEIGVGYAQEYPRRIREMGKNHSQ